MSIARRTFLQFAGAAAVTPSFSRHATAQAYPTRPITMVVPFVAGGPTSVLGRVLAERMRGPLGKPIIIENVGGADGSIGVGRAARAGPDGYTVNIGTAATHVLNAAFYPLQYDVLEDFAPISPLVTGPLVLFANRTIPAKDLRELIVWLKANPDKASAGIFAATVRLVAALFQRDSGTRFALVPYRGSAPIIQDLVAGQIDLAFDALVQLPLVRAGAIRAYAVNREARSALAPDIPTFAEMGLASLSRPISWWGLFAPKGTPAEIIGKLNAAATEALADPAVQSQLTDLGFEVFPRERQTAEALGARVKADAEKWLPLIKELGVKRE
jgi:tripartite-type tricarboxylate transporter receptor subunit TctC